MNRKMLQFGLAGIVMSTVYLVNTDISYAEENTKVVGTFQSTILDVQIPAVTTFTYNPNTQEMITNTIGVENKTNAPIFISLKEINISEASIWKPKLVSPNTYEVEEWRNLTKEKSLREVALGLLSLDNKDWLYPFKEQEVWSNNTKIGTIKTKGNIEVKPELRAGTSLPVQTNLIANYIFEFGLEEGETRIPPIVPEIDYENTILDMNTEELFSNLKNVYSPSILGKELFAVDYFDSTKIYVYDTETKELKRTLSYQSKQYVSNKPTMKRFYSLGNDGEHLLAFSSDTTIDIIDKNTGEVIGTKTLNKGVNNAQLIGSATFVVEQGYLYVTPYYSTSIYIYNYSTGEFVKEIKGFNSTSGVSIRNGKLVVLERTLKQIHLFKLTDPLNPIKEGSLKLTNGYDNVGLTMDKDYVYIATYQNNKIIRYPLINKSVEN